MLLLLHLGPYTLLLSGHGSIALDRFLPVEVVHLGVGLGNLLSGSGPAHLAASRRLLLHRGLDEGGLVPRSQVGQLERQLGVLDDRIGKHFLIPETNITAFLDQLCVLSDVWAASDLAAGAYVLQVEELPVLVAPVPESKVGAGAVLGGSPHQLGHYARYVKRQLAQGLLRQVLGSLDLGSTAGVDHFSFTVSLASLGRRPLLPVRSCGTLGSLGLELLLPLGLQLGSQRQRLHDLPGIPHAAGHVHDGLVADHVGEAVHLSEELGLEPVDVLSLPEACCHHGCASVYQDAPG